MTDSEHQSKPLRSGYRALKTKPASHVFIQKLYADHHQGLLKFLNAKLNSPEEAEDVAQSAYEKMMGVARIEQLDNVKSYLYQTALNLAIDRMRKEKHGFNYQQMLADAMTHDESSQSASPEMLAHATQQLELVNSALAQLPENCRRAFLMHRAQHLSYRQISAALGVSASMVEKHIIQALKHLRKSLR